MDRGTEINDIAAFSSLSLESMQALARALAVRLKPGDVLTLAGEVGAGKTAFARALIGAIAHGTPDVTSPTFTLMQSYAVQIGNTVETLWHLDLYRMEEARELDALGLEDLWPHIVLIEWPEIAAHLLPPDRLDIAFTFGPTQETRALTLCGNDAWRRRLSELV